MVKGLKKKKLSYIVLNVILCYFFVTIAWYLELAVDDQIAFFSPDSRTYFQVGRWLYERAPTEYLTIRPFLFPLILFSSFVFLGIKGYFFFQLIFWFGSANILFATLTRLFNNAIISSIGVALLISNLTFLMLTFHGLSEVFVIFLLTIFIYSLTRWIDSTRKDKWLLSMLFILVLLSVTKPIFFYFTILSVLIIIPILFYKYKYYKSISKMIKVLLLFIPLFFQMGIMKVNFNTFNVSTIGSGAFKYFLFQRFYVIETDLNKEGALQKFNGMNNNDIVSYILSHKKSFIETFFLNLKENINTFSPYYLEVKKNKNPGVWIVYEGKVKNYMLSLNTTYLYLHIVFFFISLLIITSIFYRKEFTNRNVCILILCFLLYGFLFLSGVSYGEGDRLVLPALPIWIVLYAMLLFSHRPSYYFKGKTKDNVPDFKPI